MKPEKPWLIALFIGVVMVIVSIVAACFGKARKTSDGGGEASFMLLATILVGFLAVCVIGFTTVVLSSRARQNDPVVESIPLMDRPVTERELLKARYRLNGLVGGEKLNLLNNQRVKRILLSKYNIAVTPLKMGSVEMMTVDHKNQDFLWPSSLILCQDAIRQESIFNSPIVFYTGWDTARDLIGRGIVEKREDTYYIVRFGELLADDNIIIQSADPTKSGSGYLFAAFLATEFNSKLPQFYNLEEIEDKLRSFYARLGAMEHSSNDLFSKFVSVTDVDRMIVGYENQRIEFMQSNPENKSLIQDSICVLYPESTAWASHPIISLTENGNLLIEAMLDKDIQRIAWLEHGFRPGSMNMGFDAGITAVRVKTTLLPSVEVMNQILSRLF